MKTSLHFPIVLALGVVVHACSIAQAGEPPAKNRVGFSFRTGFNISARFTGSNPALVSPLTPRTTPNGDLFNYDDGYVLTDISGNAGGLTWYWGYDDSASQIAGNEILFSRTAPAQSFTSPSLDDGPSFGGELLYTRELGRLNDGRWGWGFEVALNYLSVGLSDNSAYAIGTTRTTDAFPFFSGTTPPASPYQGTFGGPGFVIGATPTTSTSVSAAGATVTGQREFESDVWGFRLGPYLELPISDTFSVLFSGGLALAVVDGEASWTETITIPGVGTIVGTGESGDSDLLWGFSVGASAVWNFREDWSLIGSLQYQSLQSYRLNAGARTAEVDFGNSVFLTIGLGYEF